ncbi:hypothetical protein [Aliidiomarina sanyensis]|uniref:DUF998 domain-containing protein n=1 Tax=Aliidiomarina sanyensis TaxID=1249555 RepID=A0A432WS41_9GAMM|nr:hypothetical protein [Aliidiomarina sanyensis]RUO36579.1 hypothetical protein CWE11_01840 [Aliidiomarina sanyensis]
MQPKHIAWIVFLIPILAANGAYLIGRFEGVAYECIPYLHGCTSISRAARLGSAIFWFRGLMMPIAVFLFAFWYLHYHWLAHITGKRPFHVLISGVIGAVFLILYVDFLGTEGDFYRFMREQGILFYFAFTALAQMFSIHWLHAKTEVLHRRLKRLLQAQASLIIIAWGFAMVQLTVKTLELSWSSQMENAAAWNVSLLMSFFYLFTAWMWQHTQYRWTLLNKS